MYPVEAEVRPAKGPRPFLPFPQAEGTGEPSVRFAMTQPVVGMHSFYTPPPPLPGHFISPPPYHPPQVPLMNDPMPPTDQPPAPAEKLPVATTNTASEEKPPIQSEPLAEVTPSANSECWSPLSPLFLTLVM